MNQELVFREEQAGETVKYTEMNIICKEDQAGWTRQAGSGNRVGNLKMNTCNLTMNTNAMHENKK